MDANTNKLFEINKSLINSSMVSKVRTNREYLISRHGAEELNTYVSFTPFATFSDSYALGEENSAKIGAMGVRSIFNRAGAVLIGTMSDYNKDSIITGKASSWRISNNVPLMDNRASREAIRQDSGCTVKDLVHKSQKGLLGREIYSFSDFMYCKYLGKMSNNYLITLRRFPYPVDDYISSIGEGEMKLDKQTATKNVDSLGCLVTWMGTPGNEISNILKYSMSLPYRVLNAELKEGADADSTAGPANAIAAMFDPVYRQQYASGHAGGAVVNYMTKFFNVGDQVPYPASQYENYRDNNKAYGPIDVVKSTYARSEEGLSFAQDINIVFDYELRSYNGINGRQAMLDLLANILNVTYSTGNFWGGGIRSLGAHQNNIFTNMEIYKKHSGFSDFVNAFSKDVTTISNSVKDSIQKNGGILQTAKKLSNELSGMLIGGLLNGLGRPSKIAMNSILSPAPVGFWHLTIGNPNHPIISIGNMILKNTTVEHYGPLGLDDFPTGIRVTCELTRGKPRDIRDIEKMYTQGNDRIYTPMGPKIFDMYKYSKEYNGSRDIDVFNDIGADMELSVGDNNNKAKDSLSNMDAVLTKYFGHNDTQSIKVAAMEQDMGAQGKKKTGTAGGNSSVKVDSSSLKTYNN